MSQMFNFKKFLIEHFGSPQGLIRFLASYGAELPKEQAVDKWFQRESVPTNWMIVLLAYLQLDNGGPVPLYNYIKIDQMLGDDSE